MNRPKPSDSSETGDSREWQAFFGEQVEDSTDIRNRVFKGFDYSLAKAE